MAVTIVLGLYRDNGKENGNYYNIIGYMWGFSYYYSYIYSWYIVVVSGAEIENQDCLSLPSFAHALESVTRRNTKSLPLNPKTPKP